MSERERERERARAKERERIISKQQLFPSTLSKGGVLGSRPYHDEQGIRAELLSLVEVERVLPPWVGVGVGGWQRWVLVL